MYDPPDVKKHVRIFHEWIIDPTLCPTDHAGLKEKQEAAEQ